MKMVCYKAIVAIAVVNVRTFPLSSLNAGIIQRMFSFQFSTSS